MIFSELIIYRLHILNFKVSKVFKFKVLPAIDNNINENLVFCPEYHKTFILKCLVQFFKNSIK